MIKSAAIWLEGVQKRRIREERGRINSWAKLKKHMRRKYVPTTYKQQQYVQFNALTQGNKSVQEYIHEWDRLSVLYDINDLEELRVSKFIAGLRENIIHQLMITLDLTVHSVGLQAIELERFANRFTYTPKQTSGTYAPRNPSTTIAPKKDTQNIGKKLTQ